MNKNINNNKGITMIALVVTIIVLFIIAGISLRAFKKDDNNISTSKDEITKSELSKIQQALFENYFKYKQTGNNNVLIGTKLSLAEATQLFNTMGSSETLKVTEYDEENPSTFYYKLQSSQLKEIGFKNVSDDDEYVINYSTGEVFNFTQKKSSDGEILYIHAQ